MVVMVEKKNSSFCLNIVGLLFLPQIHHFISLLFQLSLKLKMELISVDLFNTLLFYHSNESADTNASTFVNLNWRQFWYCRLHIYC